MARYKAHINVEICASIHAIKISQPNIFIKGRIDDIKLDSERRRGEFVFAARYLVQPRAVAKIFEYRVHEEAPNVVRLAVHATGSAQFTWKADDTAERREDVERLQSPC